MYINNIVVGKMTKSILFTSSLIFFSFVSAPFYASADNTHSISFDGIDDYLHTSDTSHLSVTSDFTIEYWVNFDSFDTGLGTLVTKYGGPTNSDRAYWTAYYDNNGTGTVETRISSDGTGPNTSVKTLNYELDTNTWYHMAYVYDSSAGEIAFYIADSATGTHTLVGTMSGHNTSIKDSDSRFMLASSDGDDPNVFFDGKMDDVRVWNDVRTFTELNSNFLKELEGNETNLVGYWTFNSNYKDFVNDQDFTNNGGALFDTEVPFNSADVADLSEQLKALVEGQGLMSQDEERLLMMLNEAEEAYAEGNASKLLGILNGFLGQLNGLVQSGRTDKAVFEEAREIALEIEALLVEEAEANENEVPLITQVASPYPPESADWESDLFGNGVPGWCGNTIGECGCAISSLSMLAQHRGITGLDGMAVNPRNLNNWLNANGGYTSGNEVIWNYALAYFSSVPGYTHFTLDHRNAESKSLIDSYVKRGDLAIGYKEQKGHYFVLTDVLLDGNYSVNDPYWYLTKTTNDLKDTVNHVQNYGGSVDRANLFSYSAKLKPLPKWIEIHLGSPAELLLVDSHGRRAGYDPDSGTIVSEIPGSSYSQSEGVVTKDELPPETHLEKVLTVQLPTDDIYTLQVIGTGTGDYDLTVATNGGFDNTEITREEGTITPGAVDSYVIDVPEKNSSERAASRLRQLADEKEAEQQSVATRLREIAARLEENNVSPSDINFAAELTN